MISLLSRVTCCYKCPCCEAFSLLKLTLDISCLFAEVGHLRIAICIVFSLLKTMMDIGLVEMTSLFIVLYVQTLFSGGVLNLCCDVKK